VLSNVELLNLAQQHVSDMRRWSNWHHEHRNFSYRASAFIHECNASRPSVCPSHSGIVPKRLLVVAILSPPNTPSF